MFKKKKLLALLLVGVTMLAGCGSAEKKDEKSTNKVSDKEVTVDSLFSSSSSLFSTEDVSIESLLKDVKSADIDVKLVLDSVLKTEGMSMDVKADLGMFFGIETDKGVGFKIAGDINAAGVSESLKEEGYVTFSDGDDSTDDIGTVYEYDSEEDAWYKYSQDVSIKDLYEDLGYEINNEDYEKYSSVDTKSITDKLTLGKDKVNYNGINSYIVSGELTLQDIMDIAKEQKLLDDMPEGVDLSAIEGVDLSGVVIVLEYYFAVDGNQLVGCKIDLSKSNINEIIKSIMTTSDSESDYSLEINDCYIELKLGELNSYKYELPKDVADKAVERSENDIQYDDEFDYSVDDEILPEISELPEDVVE